MGFPKAFLSLGNTTLIETVISRLQPMFRRVLVVARDSKGLKDLDAVVLTDYPNELSHEEGLALIDQLADFGVPVLLLSGGEPLYRPDILDLASYAVGKGLRAVISTNGSLITPELAKEIKAAGVSYVGVSLDGIGEVHDRFRGVKGTFQKSLNGIQYCREAGVKTGLRFTLTRHNYHQVEDIFRLVEGRGNRATLFLPPSLRGQRQAQVPHRPRA